MADFRVGITTVREKWQHALPGVYRYLPVDYLREKFGDVADPDEAALFVAGALMPDPFTVDDVMSLREGRLCLPRALPWLSGERGAISRRGDGKDAN